MTLPPIPAPCSMPPFPTGRLGPFTDPSGKVWLNNFYGVNFGMMSASDGDSSWIQYQGAGEVYGYLDTIYDAADQIIYYVGGMYGPGIDVLYTDISPARLGNTYKVNTNNGPVIQPDANNQTPGFLAQRKSNGDFVVVYQGPTVGGYRQVYASVLSGITNSGTPPEPGGGVWGTPINLRPVSAHCDLKCACVGASDRVHVLMTNQASLTHQSLDTTNTVDTGVTIAGGASATSYYTITYVSAEGEIIVPGPATGQPPLRAPSLASPSWTPDANAVGSEAPAVGPTVFAYDPSTGTTYAYYVDASGNVWVNVSSNKTWGSSTKQTTGGGNSGISVGQNAAGVLTVYTGSKTAGTLNIGSSVAQPATGPVATVNLAPARPPAFRTQHSLNFRGRVQTTANATLRMALMEGATNRSGTLESPLLSTTVTSYTIPIPDTTAAAISSYSDLSLQVWGFSGGGATPMIEVEDIWLQVPQAAAPVVRTQAMAVVTAQQAAGAVALIPTAAVNTTAAVSLTAGAALVPSAAATAAALAAATVALQLVPNAYAAAQAQLALIMAMRLTPLAAATAQATVLLVVPGLALLNPRGAAQALATAFAAAAVPLAPAAHAVTAADPELTTPMSLLVLANAATAATVTIGISGHPPLPYLDLPMSLVVGPTAGNGLTIGLEPCALAISPRANGLAVEPEPLGVLIDG